MILSQIRNFCSYLLHKKAEIKDLERKDALLAKLVLDIHRSKASSSFMLVPLFAIQQVHAIDRDNAIAATEQRKKNLQEVKELLLEQHDITREFLAAYLPSVSWIKVVRHPEGFYAAFEGNGRVAALQQVFSPADTMNIEVEEYRLQNSDKIITLLDQVRMLNFLPADGNHSSRP